MDILAYLRVIFVVLSTRQICDIALSTLVSTPRAYKTNLLTSTTTTTTISAKTTSPRSSAPQETINAKNRKSLRRPEPKIRHPLRSMICSQLCQLLHRLASRQSKIPDINREVDPLDSSQTKFGPSTRARSSRRRGSKSTSGFEGRSVFAP